MRSNGLGLVPQTQAVKGRNDQEKSLYETLLTAHSQWCIKLFFLSGFWLNKQSQLLH